ncbi:thiosulfate ABC transporter substrate-binding protein CysP [Paracoccus sp. (in: a-proteobacteria)]|uniref:thiosulfate ABC transporter substrate-binding protein CysP n=1 Tax=Paracoccus sp. TaxID=267 RepID=UPI0026DFD0FF|nr:thiosulfate ABC transporter substrate-binding protein CysP [Paracoccus sp. (in: a-proteobacteria)]MDO5369054.1 thiosulfate ABC transporter substrate-binding protein CysP [Paracoccus sp. (in: a-proteobacteria)]
MKLGAIKAAVAALVLAASPAFAQDRLLNVSYDISRELFEALNPVFAEHWKAQNGRDVTIEQSHAGSSRQARSILEGLPADVVTFNQETDVNMLAKGGMVAENWREAFPNGASPWYSAPAFLVRKGNPKNIQNWSDLAREDVQVVFPNPRTSGNGRYTYLAAYAFGLRESGGDQAAAQDFVRRIMANVPVFDTGGRAATQTFVERGIADVLVTFEAETRQIAAQYADRGLVSITPPVSLFAAFPVAVVEENAERNGTTELATEYLNWLYSPEAQRVVAQGGNRTANEEVTAEFADQFPPVELLNVDEVFGGWDKVESEHFASGGILDQVFVNQ